eukprot:scaffold1912_cov167-Amphora_coffeaeformis.AAC.16
MPPAIAGLVTSVAAALCYGLCVNHSAVSKSFDLENEPPTMDMTGEDISLHGETETIISSVGGSTALLQEATRAGFFNNRCFLHVSQGSTDAMEMKSVLSVSINLFGEQQSRGCRLGLNPGPKSKEGTGLGLALTRNAFPAVRSISYCSILDSLEKLVSTTIFLAATP